MEVNILAEIFRDTILGGRSQYTEGWRNFNRLEIKTDLKFKKGKWKVTYFGWNNPTQLHMLSAAARK